MMLEQALKALEAEQDHTAALKRVRGPLTQRLQGQPEEDA